MINIIFQLNAIKSKVFGQLKLPRFMQVELFRDSLPNEEVLVKEEGIVLLRKCQQCGTRSKESNTIILRDLYCGSCAGNLFYKDISF